MVQECMIHNLDHGAALPEIGSGKRIRGGAFCFALPGSF